MSNFEDNTRQPVPQSTTRSSVPRKEASGLSTVDFVLIGIAGFLFLACIWVAAALIIPKFVEGITPRFTPQLFFTILIYVCCVGVGWLWGRYQGNTQAQKEISLLKREIYRLKNENIGLQTDKATLQNQLRAVQSAARVAGTPLSESSAGVIMPPVVSPMTQPKSIEQLTPPPNLYDTPPHEPDDPSDLPAHPHVRIFPAMNEKDSLHFGWRIVGASRRGYGHAYEGKYREDDFNIKIYSSAGKGLDIALIAIADGVSSKSLSRRGARAAVLGATESLGEQIDRLRYLANKQAKYPDYQDETRAILLDALEAAHHRVEEVAERSRIPVDELQSTLLVFLVMPWDENHLLVASTQIGDGALFVLQQKPDNQWNWLQQPQIQSAGNEVQPFMRATPDEWAKYFRCNLIDHVACIMGMTDGTADDIEPPRPTRENPNPDPFARVHDFYQRIILPALTHQSPGEELVNKLGYKKRSSFDDRTVVCLYR